jgi:hypothetical protein
MFSLTDPKISFILITPETDSCTPLENNLNCERLCSVLYSKDFTVFSLKEWHQNKYRRSFLGISSENSNDDIRQESIHILEFLDIESAVIKYLDSDTPVSISKHGVERLLEFSMYESDENSKIWIHEGISFSFREKVRYHYPTKKEHLKSGQVVEYYNNNKWNTKEIVKLDEEFDKMYKLLMKYNKLRIPT